MKRLALRENETIIEFLQRLKKTIRTPEWRARKREEQIIKEWKNGKISEERRVGKKLTPDAKFHSPKEE